jgi:hypothetical protein
MFFNKSVALVLIGVMLAVGLVGIAVASTSTNGQVSPQVQTRLRSVTCTVGRGSSQVVDLYNPTINVPYDNAVFFTVKAECTGPTSQKGNLYMYNLDSFQYQNAILVTPGKLSTLKTNPPYIWHSTGTHSIEIGIASPDGHLQEITLLVNVV